MKYAWPFTPKVLYNEELGSSWQLSGKYGYLITAFMFQIQISAQFLVSSITILVILHAMLGATAYLILLERKVAAWAQDRIGPNRTGFSFGQDNIWRALGLNFMNRLRFLGLGQALADGVKLLFKEDYTPPRVDRVLFTMAPVLVMIPAMIGWAVIPWGGGFRLSDAPTFDMFWGLFQVTGANKIVQVAVLPVHLGAIYVLAVGSVGVYGMTLGSYASNNKYAFLGGLRATAQMLSYEIPMGLCVLLMMMYYATADLSLIVAQQAGGAWGILAHPFLCVILFICMLAETNRAPFDLAEAEQELVGGFHTEYTSMRWAMYFLGEYMHMIAGCAFISVLFLGGWDIAPFTGLIGLELPAVATGWAGLLLVGLKAGVLMGKITFLLFLTMWIRWTLPRLRFDQLMQMAWSQVIPVMLFALLVGGILVALGPFGRQWWVHLISDLLLVSVCLGALAVFGRDRQINRRVQLAGSRYSPPTPHQKNTGQVTARTSWPHSSI